MRKKLPGDPLPERKAPEVMLEPTGLPEHGSGEGSGTAGLWGNAAPAQGMTCPARTWDSAAAQSSQPEAASCL